MSTAINERRFASAKVIAQLFDPAAYPNPDGDDDLGPIGPYAFDPFAVLLSLSPLGPFFYERWADVFGPVPDPWRRIARPQPVPWKRTAGSDKRGPFPDPWAAAYIARATIDRVVELARVADVGGGEQLVNLARGRIVAFVDDWCGTPPRPRPPLPWPFRLDVPDGEQGIHPIDLVVMGVQFVKAGEALGASSISADLGQAGETLVQTGLARLS